MHAEKDSVSLRNNESEETLAGGFIEAHPAATPVLHT